MMKNNASKMWLDLPNDMKDKNLSFLSFKKKLLNHLLTVQKNDLNSILNNPFPCNFSGIENVILKYCK